MPGEREGNEITDERTRRRTKRKHKEILPKLNSLKHCGPFPFAPSRPFSLYSFLFPLVLRWTDCSTICTFLPYAIPPRSRRLRGSILSSRSDFSPWALRLSFLASFPPSGMKATRQRALSSCSISLCLSLCPSLPLLT